jgi:surface antigen
LAGRRVSSYTRVVCGHQPERPHRRIASIAVLMAALAPGLTGCAGIMMPMSAWMSGEPPAAEVTGTIPKPTVAAPAPDSDSDVIRSTVAGAQSPESVALPWKNTASGNSGTISKIAPAKATNGAPCRDFETTLVTIDGVRLYRGRACQGYTGPWDLVRFEPTDAVNPG